MVHFWTTWDIEIRDGFRLRCMFWRSSKSGCSDQGQSNGLYSGMTGAENATQHIGSDIEGGFFLFVSHHCVRKAVKSALTEFTS